MKYLSVCSGIEAASVAWHALGWTPAAFSEIEPFPSAVLSHRFPGVPNLGDMTKYKEWQNVGPIDLMVGGTPCQAFSVAGLRKGLVDPRGNLALVYLGIADHFRPRWMVWENVPGVLSSSGGRDFGAFLGALAELGYGFAYRVLDAQYFGVAQRRRRVFVVGYLGDWRPAAAVLFESESVRGYPAPSREAGKEITHDLAPCLTSSGRGVERVGDTRGQDPVVACFGGNNQSGPIDVSTACNAHGGSGRLDFESETFVTHPLTARYDSSEDGCGRGTPIVPVAFNMHKSGNEKSSLGVSENRVDCLRAFEKSPFAVMPSIESAVRRLTPRECERLQGFPDDWTAIPYRGKPAADGPRYKAIGNSMAVPVMAWIGNLISAVDQIKKPLD